MGLVLSAPVAKGVFDTINDRMPILGGLIEMGTLTLAAALVFIYLRPIEQFIYFQF